MAKTDDIKRTISFVQTKKKKKFFLKKKKYFSLASKSKNFRFFDEDGYEVYDPILIDIIFDAWYDDYNLNHLLDVMTTLDEEDYALFEEDEISSINEQPEVIFNTENSEPTTITEHEEEIVEDAAEVIEEIIEEQRVTREPVYEEIEEEASYDDDSDDGDDGGSDDD